MKTAITFSFLLLFCLSSFAQPAELPEDPADYFDFWVGEWELSWKQQNDSMATGTNLIEKTLDGVVIQEHFKALTGNFKGYKGTSISVYNPQRETWHQAWADNNGGYINLKGRVEGTKRIFQTELRELPNGQTIINRMVFYDIKKDSFTWDWESSTDKGETWKLNWRIFYERAEE